MGINVRRRENFIGHYMKKKRKCVLQNFELSKNGNSKMLCSVETGREELLIKRWKVLWDWKDCFKSIPNDG